VLAKLKVSGKNLSIIKKSAVIIMEICNFTFYFIPHMVCEQSVLGICSVYVTNKKDSYFMKL
jgi:hypothetical protein